MGTIEFDGEGGYVHVDADRARGSVSTFRPVECPIRERPATSGETLFAFTPSKDRSLVAIGLRLPSGKSESFISGARVEGRGRMQVERTSSVVARRERFVFDERLAFATLQPPRPFGEIPGD